MTLGNTKPCHPGCHHTKIKMLRQLSKQGKNKPIKAHRKLHQSSCPDGRSKIRDGSTISLSPSTTFLLLLSHRKSQTLQQFPSLKHPRLSFCPHYPIQQTNQKSKSCSPHPPAAIHFEIQEVSRCPQKHQKPLPAAAAAATDGDDPCSRRRYQQRARTKTSRWMRRIPHKQSKVKKY